MLEKMFSLRSLGTTVKTEVLAGIATFLAAMYIIVVNPSILSSAGVPFAGALTATVLISFFGSVMMGLYARNPILVAPGMGINALFTYTMVLGAGIEWQTALGCVFWSGVLFGLLALFNDAHNRVFSFGESGLHRAEIVSFRLGASAPPDVVPALNEGIGDVVMREEHRIFDQGEWRDCLLLSRAAIGAEASGIPGPALVEDGTSTIFVPQGWTATVDKQDNILLKSED